MQKYAENLVDLNGNVLSGVSVTVTTLAGAAASLYAGNGVTPISGNVVQTDAFGYFELYAANGRYSFAFSGAGIQPYTRTDIVLYDPADGPADGTVTVPKLATDTLAYFAKQTDLDALSIVYPKLPAPSQVVYIAHRGSAAVYPEETYVAYNNSIADNSVYLESDVQTLSDGTLVLTHDTTVDRTTTSTGNVSTFNATTWAALVVDANTWHGSNYGNALPAPPTLQAWVDKFNGKAIFVPEDKDAVSMTALVRALINSGVRKDQALLQCFTLGNLPTVIAAGYPALFLTGGATSDIATAQSYGVTWVGIDQNASNANIQAWVASGIKTTCWTVNRRYTRDLKLALGVTGFFCDDPVYMRNVAPLYTTDKFGYQTWVPGMLSGTSEDGLSLTGRGVFTAPSYWGYSVSTADFRSCLQGYLCPIKGQSAPNSYSVTYKVTFDSANAGDITRWAGVFIGVDDRAYTDTAGDATGGYHFLMRKNGQLQIYVKPVNGSQSQIGSVNGSTIADGTELTFKITVTATTLKLALLNGDGSDNNSVTVTDSSMRGAYLSLSRNALACRFRSLTIV